MAPIAFNAGHQAEQIGDATTFAGALQTRGFTMTMLTPTRGQFERAAYSSGNRSRIGARLRLDDRQTILAFLLFGAVMAGAALTAIMALKVIVYLPRFHS